MKVSCAVVPVCTGRLFRRGLMCCGYLPGLCPAYLPGLCPA